MSQLQQDIKYAEAKINGLLENRAAIDSQIQRETTALETLKAQLPKEAAPEATPAVASVVEAVASPAPAKPVAPAVAKTPAAPL